MNNKYTCPACGYPELKRKPYDAIPSIAETRNKPVPYHALWGRESYAPCPCCGFEPGNDDNPGENVKGLSFEEYLAEWINDGCVWLCPEEKPQDWTLEVQLRAAGLQLPPA